MSLRKETTRVLLVEDTDIDATRIEDFLVDGLDRRYQIDRVATLRDATEALLHSDRYDVLLLDLSLPDSRGIATFRRIKSAARMLPVVVQSALEHELIAVEAVRMGAQDYMVKGHFTADGLRRAIRYAIERKQSERALRESQERFAVSVRGANDGLWDWDLRSNKVFYSARWKEILGYEASALDDTPRSWFDLVHPDDVDGLAAAINGHLDQLTGHLEHEYRVVHKNGTVRWVSTRGLAVRDEETGRATRIAGSLADINKRKQVEARLVYNTIHDRLTGLPNRALCLDRLGHAMRRRSRDPAYRLAVLFLDIDEFKLINDTMGHVLGDALLVAFARRLKQLIRPGDTCARLGGDEFCVILEDIGESEAERVADRIGEAFADPLRVAGKEVFASASIGIAECGADHQRPEDILADADIAMYRAKRTGKSKYVIYDIQMRRRASRRLAIETDLRQALSSQEFALHYQPIVRMATGEVTGFEALLRWHTANGTVSAGRFIPIAEETGLIVPIGNWVLQEAVEMLPNVQPPPGYGEPVTISVNLSPRQFRQPDLVDRIAHLLKTNSVKPSQLILEITEGVFLEFAGVAMDLLNQLNTLGVRIHLDDFGKGFSSLSYLRQFPVHRIKIDKAFVGGMVDSTEDRAIVRAIVGLGQSLGKGVIAEGIETEAQAAMLREMQCGYGQGYFFAKPGVLCDTGPFKAVPIEASERECQDTPLDEPAIRPVIIRAKSTPGPT